MTSTPIPPAPMRRVLSILALVLALAVPLASSVAAPAGADDGGRPGIDNIAVAINTKDGSSLFKFAFSITKLSGAVVDPGNAAVAYASCVECQTVAVAIQFVIVEGSPAIFTPENVAVAVNQNCTLCDTMALAYQVVIQKPGPVRLSEDGRDQMRELVKELRRLEKAGLTNAELFPKVEAIFRQMVAVISTELRPVESDEDDQSNSAENDGESTTTVVQNSSTTSSPTQDERSSTTTVVPRTGTPTSTTTSTTGSPNSSTSSSSTTTSTRPSTTSTPTTTTSAPTTTTPR